MKTHIQVLEATLNLAVPREPPYLRDPQRG